MPQLLGPSSATASASAERSRSRQRATTDTTEHRNMWSRLSLQKIGSWLKRDHDPESPLSPRWGEDKHGHSSADESNKENGKPSGDNNRPSGLLGRRSSRKVVPGLPRPLTFKRMNSEKRDRLLPVPTEPEGRRASSMDRRVPSSAQRNLSPPPISIPSMSAPEVLSPPVPEQNDKEKPKTIGGGEMSNIPPGSRQVDYDESMSHLSAGDPPPLSVAGESFRDDASFRSASVDDFVLQDELDAKWILNLSMHFRDMSDREKFFITYAEEPNKWRRVTVSCDYRNMEPDSLEHDLKGLHYQRDKSARIYEAIRDSLPAIQFYDTVTNLKLQTDDGRLHVHVTEDVNEIIPYPATSAVAHLRCEKFRESSISFDSHISGFVYKVTARGRSYIKKEIPGPDAVEEFLYEINALRSLQDSKSVIKFEGIIVDETTQLLKGLLISYAEQGALVDILYDLKHTDELPWTRRAKWARQIVEGLSEIHEAGFVQGDFTLSNIVIDGQDNAKIIDINRRGCPVGWEPPELARLIESGQRISIYIGVKSDLFQLGMVLWALAEQNDEPERSERPLIRMYSRYNDSPDWFRDIIKACLEDKPRDRPAAKTILLMFPNALTHGPEMREPSSGISVERSGKEKVDSARASSAGGRRIQYHTRSTSSAVNIPSTDYLDSTSSYVLPNRRGRSPTQRSNSHRRSDYSPYPGPPSVMSLGDSELENELASLPASRETRWEQVYVDGDTRLVQRGGLSIDARDFSNPEPAEICITPPGDLDSPYTETTSKGEDTPLQLSTMTELQPLPQAASSSTAPIPQNQAQAPLHASFSDRVHRLSTVEQDTSNPLAQLENEIALYGSVTESSISRTGTGFTTLEDRFSPPLHKDSGFAEPSEHVSYEAERIRHSLDEERLEIDDSPIETKRIEGKLWDEEEGTTIPECISSAEQEKRDIEEAVTRALEHISIEPRVHVPAPISAIAAQDRILEEKVSNTTIRPPSILIPEFHHGTPRVVAPDREHETIEEKEVKPTMEEPDVRHPKQVDFVEGTAHGNKEHQAGSHAPFLEKQLPTLAIPSGSSRNLVDESSPTSSVDNSQYDAFGLDKRMCDSIIIGKAGDPDLPSIRNSHDLSLLPSLLNSQELPSIMNSQELPSILHSQDLGQIVNDTKTTALSDLAKGQEGMPDAPPPLTSTEAAKDTPSLIPPS